LSTSHLDAVGVGKDENVGVFVQRRESVSDLPYRVAAVLPPVDVSELFVNQICRHSAPILKWAAFQPPVV
jgi:hypothetical protein